MPRTAHLQVVDVIFGEGTNIVPSLDVGRPLLPVKQVDVHVFGRQRKQDLVGEETAGENSNVSEGKDPLIIG